MVKADLGELAEAYADDYVFTSQHDWPTIHRLFADEPRVTSI